MLTMAEITSKEGEAQAVRAFVVSLENQDTRHLVNLSTLSCENTARHDEVDNFRPDKDVVITNGELARLLIALAGQLLHIPALRFMGKEKIILP
jgi:hypothetical protein